MQGFEDVTLSWQGQDYVVPANRQLMLIAKIEDALAGEGGEVAVKVLFREGGVPHSRLACAFGAALRHAGAKVTDEEIYLSIQHDIADKSKEAVAVTIQAMLMALLAIVSPPVAKAMVQGRTQAEGAAEKKA